MALLKTVGKSIGSQMGDRGVIPLMAAAGGVGALAAVFGGRGKPNAYRDSIFPTIQEDIFGSPTAFQDTLSGALINSLSGMSNKDVYLPGTYYYGRPANLRSSYGKEVSGDMVFGMYNLRR